MYFQPWLRMPRSCEYSYCPANASNGIRAARTLPSRSSASSARGLASTGKYPGPPSVNSPRHFSANRLRQPRVPNNRRSANRILVHQPLSGKLTLAEKKSVQRITASTAPSASSCAFGSLHEGRASGLGSGIELSRRGRRIPPFILEWGALKLMDRQKGFSANEPSRNTSARSP